MFGAMIMSFTIDVKSAMTFVVTIPALSIVVFGVMALSIPLFKKVQNRSGQSHTAHPVRDLRARELSEPSTDRTRNLRSLTSPRMT